MTSAGSDSVTLGSKHLKPQNPIKRQDLPILEEQLKFRLSLNINIPNFRELLDFYNHECIDVKIG